MLERLLAFALVVVLLLAWSASRQGPGSAPDTEGPPRSTTLAPSQGGPSAEGPPDGEPAGHPGETGPGAPRRSLLPFHGTPQEHAPGASP